MPARVIAMLVCLLTFALTLQIRSSQAWLRLGSIVASCAVIFTIALTSFLSVWTIYRDPPDTIGLGIAKVPARFVIGNEFLPKFIRARRNEVIDLSGEKLSDEEIESRLQDVLEESPQAHLAFAGNKADSVWKFQNLARRQLLLSLMFATAVATFIAALLLFAKSYLSAEKSDASKRV